MNAPQCSSHDFLEGCSKRWLKLILEHFVKSHWISWEALEKIITKFPYKNKDSNNRPAILRSKQMKVKGSRRIIGTFAEVSNLIRSMTQLLYDHIKDTDDPYWQWFLQIRKFLRFMLMPKLTESQVTKQIQYNTLIDFSFGNEYYCLTLETPHTFFAIGHSP